MKIVCRSGNEYDLKMKFKRYQELQKAVRGKVKGTQKHARVLQKEDATETELELAESIIGDLQDELEELVIPFVTEALQNAGVDIDEIDEPEDVAEMVARLLGQAPQGAANPLAALPDATPTG